MSIELGDSIRGPAGTATELKYRHEEGKPSGWQATVAQWFLDCPGQSPAWRHYVLGVVHLRPIEGADEAAVRVPHATHEVLLVALSQSPTPAPDDPETWLWLLPVNACEQVQLPDDAAAAQLLRLCAQAVVNGTLPAEPPLAGQVEPWRSTLIRSAAHARGEPHSPCSFTTPGGS